MIDRLPTAKERQTESKSNLSEPTNERGKVLLLFETICRVDVFAVFSTTHLVCSLIWEANLRKFLSGLRPTNNKSCFTDFKANSADF